MRSLSTTSNDEDEDEVVVVVVALESPSSAARTSESRLLCGARFPSTRTRAPSTPPNFRVAVVVVVVAMAMSKDEKRRNEWRRGGGGGGKCGQQFSQNKYCGQGIPVQNLLYDIRKPGFESQ